MTQRRSDERISRSDGVVPRDPQQVRQLRDRGKIIRQLRQSRNVMIWKDFGRGSELGVRYSAGDAVGVKS